MLGNMIKNIKITLRHKYPVGLPKDHIRTKELIEKGFKVLRLWERDINKININTFQNKLLATIQ